VSGMAPANSFYNFVLKQLDDDVKPHAALAAYRAHMAILQEQAYKNLKGSGMMFDLFHPMSKVRHWDLRIHKLRQSAQKFVADFRRGHYAELLLQAPPGVCSSTCQTAGHLKPPHFAFDANSNVLVFDNLHAKVSMLDIYDTLCSFPGFLAMSAPRKPAPGEGTREVKVRFGSMEHAGAAINALHQMPCGQDLNASLAKQSKKVEGLVLPPDMATADRIIKDVALSADVLRKLDNLSGVALDATQAVLDVEMPMDAKLDLQLLYLRRVHHFCFYAGTRCHDEWELEDRCGSAVLRSKASEGAVALEGDWGIAHEARVRAFLASEDSEHARPVLPICRKEPLRATFLAMCDERIEKAAEGKFKCVECGKLFKAPSMSRSTSGKSMRQSSMSLSEQHMRTMHARCSLQTLTVRS